VETDTGDDEPRPLPEAYYRQQKQLRDDKTLRSRLRRRFAPVTTVIDTIVGDGTERGT